MWISGLKKETTEDSRVDNMLILCTSYPLLSTYYGVLIFSVKVSISARKDWSSLII